MSGLFGGRCFLVSRLTNFWKIMESDTLSPYESAIRALNGLQSNVAVLNLVKEKRRQNTPDNNITVKETARFLERTGIQVSDLDRLNVIHVAGTKGKGSVCAMTESILRNHGLKTGFYSSPHLIHVRERIRINGQPLPEEKFASYFWKVYDRLVETKDAVTIEEGFASMPAYFKFLTVMSFYVFLSEGVDVAVVEVGIGGSFDCTNVVQNPIVCGITTLDYDHTGILGDTIEQIAWQKAGIMKPVSIAVTMEQPQSAIEMLATRSDELKCPLYQSPPLATYGTSQVGIPFKLGIPGRQQLENASLALQLSRLWFKRKESQSYVPETIDQSNQSSSLFVPKLKPFVLTEAEINGLRNCRWPGRSQTLERGTTTFFIDGAHTPKSMEFCAEWFSEAVSQQLVPRENIVRVLIFNCTSDRSAETLLRYLVDADFDCAIFCPNMIHTEVDQKSDLANMRVSHEKAMERCEEGRKAWLLLHDKPEIQSCDAHHPGKNRHQVAIAVSGAGGILQTDFSNASDWHGHYPDASFEFSNFDHWTRSNGVCPSSNRMTAVFPCISSALKWVETVEKRLETTPGRRLQVLVTGSLHLVGGVLSIQDPELKM